MADEQQAAALEHLREGGIEDDDERRATVPSAANAAWPGRPQEPEGLDARRGP